MGTTGAENNVKFWFPRSGDNMKTPLHFTCVCQNSFT